MTSSLSLNVSGLTWVARDDHKHKGGVQLFIVVIAAAILGHPGADSGARESRNGQKRMKRGRREVKVLALTFLIPLFFYPRPTICLWVYEDVRQQIRRNCSWFSEQQHYF